MRWCTAGHAVRVSNFFCRSAGTMCRILIKSQYSRVSIKQHSRVTYLGCILEETMSGESMANKVISKVNARLKFLHQKNKYLTPNLRRLLCNALIQPHFYYAICYKLTPWLKQLIGYPLKKDIISASIQLPSNTLIINASIIWMKFLWKHQNLVHH